jgi:hypothetical protein
VDFLVGGVRKFSVSASGTTIRRTIKRFFFWEPPSASGTYKFKAKVVDRLGKVATSKSILLNIDTELPTITSIRPGDGETIYIHDVWPVDGGTIYIDGDRADISFEITASDTYSGIEFVQVIPAKADPPFTYLRGEGTDTTPPYRITVPDIKCGEHVFRVNVVDRACNCSYRDVRITVQPRPPVSGR